MSKPPATTDHTAERWNLLRDMIVLQGKLLVDGVRDLLLVPASLIAGIVSLMSGRNGRPGTQFYQMLVFGKQTERWINLFGAVKNSPEPIEASRVFAERDVDDLVGQFEAFVVEEYKRGGVTAQAKARMDKILDAVQRRSRKSKS